MKHLICSIVFTTLFTNLPWLFWQLLIFVKMWPLILLNFVHASFSSITHPLLATISHCYLSAHVHNNWPNQLTLCFLSYQQTHFSLAKLFFSMIYSNCCDVLMSNYWWRWRMVESEEKTAACVCCHDKLFNNYNKWLINMS